MADAFVDPAHFRLRAFEVEWLEPLKTELSDLPHRSAGESDGTALLLHVLIAEADRWITIGQQVGYFAQTSPSAHPAARAEFPELEWLLNAIRSQPELPSGLSVREFARALSEARDDLTADRREFLRLVYFTAEKEWDERLNQIREFAEQVAKRPEDLPASEIVERAMWGLDELGGDVSGEDTLSSTESAASMDSETSATIELQHHLPAKWRLGSFALLAKQSPIAERRLAALDEVRASIAATIHGPSQGERGLVTSKVPLNINDPVVTRDFPDGGPEISNLLPRNRNFTDRLDTIEAVRQVLKPGHSSESLTACALHGMAGVGKTQTAIEYAHHFGGHYRIIWWIRAEHSADITDNLMWLARELGISEVQEQSQILFELWRELRKRGPWLLIFDNVEDRNIERFWLPVETGSILITSRNVAYTSQVKTVIVDPFKPVAAITFLRKRSKTSEEHSAGIVAEELGYLPLALEQAGAYVEETQTSLEAYADLLVANRQPPPQILKLLKLGQPSWYNETVATALTVSISRAFEEQPQARDLLRLFAYLAPDDIPRRLVHEHAEVLSESLRSVASDLIQYDRALASLIGFSLVSADPHRIVIHRLIQLIVRVELTPTEQVFYRADVVKRLAAAFPKKSTDVATWPTCGRLLPHVLVSTESLDALLPEYSRDVGAVLQAAGLYLHMRGDDTDARVFLERALEARKQPNGTDRTAEAETLSSLGRLYYHLIDLEDAQSVTQRAIALYREVFTSGAVPVGENLIHLSRILRARGDLVAAERVAREALGILDSADGVDPSTIAAGRQVLGDVLWRRGRLVDARDVFREALRIRRSLGDNAAPIDLASSYKRLGIVSTELGELDVAEDHLQQANSLLLQHYDSNHLDVIDIDGHRADVLRKTGRLSEARALLEHAVKVQEERLGDHPDVAGSLVRYGAVLSDLGELERSVEVLDRAVRMFAHRMGERHQYVADAKLTLAESLWLSGNIPWARIEAADSLVIFEATYDSGHFSVLRAQQLLSELGS
jgi:tetratricopeptide (TPR) repeat protein